MSLGSVHSPLRANITIRAFKVMSEEFLSVLCQYMRWSHGACIGLTTRSISRSLTGRVSSAGQKSSHQDPSDPYMIRRYAGRINSCTIHIRLQYDFPYRLCLAAPRTNSLSRREGSRGFSRFASESGSAMPNHTTAISAVKGYLSLGSPGDHVLADLLD